MTTLDASSKVTRAGHRVALWSTIDRYKVSAWLDKKKMEPMFGIKVHMPMHGWCNYAEDGKPLFFDTERKAQKKIAELKTEFRAARKSLSAPERHGGGA